jgi:3-deoxy-D-manno-octulosonic-acid transferase
MQFLYSLFISLYGFAIRIAALFNPKAKRWVDGRKKMFEEFEQKRKSNTQPLIWFHCASLGEFEQGRPLIETIRREKPNHFILLSFFSPSGYEVRKNYAEADYVCYLPLDTKSNAHRFISIAKPELVFFVKYEFWLNHLNELSRNKVKHILISAIFRSDQVFFKFWGGIFRNALKKFHAIYTQDENSLQLLKSIGVSQAHKAGDTRFDRVKEIADAAKEIPTAVRFVTSKDTTIVIGSSWPSDEEILFPILISHLQAKWKMIIAPHELGEAHISQIEVQLQKLGLTENQIVRFSNKKKAHLETARVLIIDNIGMLSSLYRYGSVAYIGGGFGKSIHNTLEAAVYGMPVVFGPAFEKFNEAKELIRCGGGFGVKNREELKNSLSLLLDNAEKRSDAAAKAGNFVRGNTGASKLILLGVKY